jgi:fructose-1,6-bisphosphatase/sedoheptulose 1,7-bisphosphatase-like protein
VLQQGIGTGNGLSVDIVVYPLDGTSWVATGRNDAGVVHRFTL